MWVERLLGCWILFVEGRSSLTGCRFTPSLVRFDAGGSRGKRRECRPWRSFGWMFEDAGVMDAYRGIYRVEDGVISRVLCCLFDAFMGWKGLRILHTKSGIFLIGVKNVVHRQRHFDGL